MDEQTTRDALIAAITALAEDAKAAGENNAAIVLFTLLGAMYEEADAQLATVAQAFARQSAANIRRQN